MNRVRALVVLVVTVPVFLWASPCTCFPLLDQHEHGTPSSEAPSHDHGEHPERSGGGHDHDDAPCCCEFTQPELLVMSGPTAVASIESNPGSLADRDISKQVFHFPLSEVVEHPPPRDGPSPGNDPPIFLINCALLQ